MESMIGKSVFCFFFFKKEHNLTSLFSHRLHMLWHQGESPSPAGAAGWHTGTVCLVPPAKIPLGCHPPKPGPAVSALMPWLPLQVALKTLLHRELVILF